MPNFLTTIFFFDSHSILPLSIDQATDAFMNLDSRIFNGRSVIGYFYPEDLFDINELARKLS